MSTLRVVMDIFGVVGVVLSAGLLIYDVVEWTTNSRYFERAIGLFIDTFKCRDRNPAIAQVVSDLQKLKDLANFNHHGTRSGKAAANVLAFTGGIMLFFPVTFIAGAIIVGLSVATLLSSSNYVFSYESTYRAKLERILNTYIRAETVDGVPNIFGMFAITMCTILKISIEVPKVEDTLLR